MVAELGSVTAAARELYSSQPLLSKHLNALETELGFKLLVRSPSQVALTSAGKGFLSYARDVVEANDRAASWAAEFKRAVPARLRVQSFVGFKPTDDLVMSIKLGLSRTYWNLDFENLNIGATDPLADLGAGRCDLTFICVPDGYDLGSMRSLPVLREPLILIVGKDNPLAAKDRVCLADLAGETMWMNDGGGRYFSLAKERLVRDLGLPITMRPLPWDNADRYYEQLAQMDFGFVLDFSCVARHSAPQTLCKFVEVEDAPRMTTSAIWRSDDDNPALLDALAIIKETVDFETME